MKASTARTCSSEIGLQRGSLEQLRAQFCEQPHPDAEGRKGMEEGAAPVLIHASHAGGILDAPARES